MARTVKFDFSDNTKSIHEVNKAYLDVLSSIDCKYSKDKNKDFMITFLGCNEEEVHQEYIELVGEVEKEFSLAMFASVESILRADFVIRCQLKKKDKLSQFYRSGYNPSKRIYEYGLSDVVMKGWKLYLPEKAKIIDRMNELFRYRNWLAHGRYWVLPSNLSNIDYLTIYNVCYLFISSILQKLSKI